MDYDDFSVHVGKRTGKTYPIDVECFRAQYHAELRQADLDATAFQNRLRQTAILEADEATVKALGLDLYRLLFHDEVYAGLVSSLTQARIRNAGLRLRLRFDDPYLASLPWEFMAGEDGLPLATSPRTPIVRFLPLPSAGEPLAVSGPLRLLIMAAQPDDLPSLAVDQERRRIEVALQHLRDAGLVEWTFAPSATRRQLQRLLLQSDYHVFHFIGHGELDPTLPSPQGRLAFETEGEHGKGDLVTARDLAVLLRDSSVRLVVLNACDTGIFRLDPLRTMAPALAEAGIPAVAAMQSTIMDTAAVAFAEMFYTALANGRPVDAAVAEGRKGIWSASPATPDWGFPVLYLRAPDGVIFKSGSKFQVPGSRLEREAESVKLGTPIDQAEVVSLQERLAIHQRNLEHLRKHEAMYGLEAPLWIVNSILHEEAEIARLKERIGE